MRLPLFVSLAAYCGGIYQSLCLLGQVLDNESSLSG